MRDIRHVSEKEFWVFLGIMVAAEAYGNNGEKMFEEESEGITESHDMGRFMTKTRHKEIRYCFVYAFSDESMKEYEPWSIIQPLIDAFNECRKKKVAASM